MKEEPRYRVESEEYRTGIDYIIVDTTTGRTVRNLGSDYDQAVEIAADFNAHGYYADPRDNAVWSLRERQDDRERSAILEERFSHQGEESGEQP